MYLKLKMKMKIKGPSFFCEMTSCNVQSKNRIVVCIKAQILLSIYEFQKGHTLPVVIIRGDQIMPRKGDRDNYKAQIFLSLGIMIRHFLQVTFFRMINEECVDIIQNSANV